MRTYQHRSACYLLSNGYHRGPTADEARNTPQARVRNLSARIGDDAAPLRSLSLEKSHWRYFIAIIVIEISAFQLFVQRLPLTLSVRMCTIDRRFVLDRNSRR